MGDSFDKVVEALEAQEEKRFAHISAENKEAAMGAHELFLVLQSGGFTEDQALKIVAHRIAASEGGDDPAQEQ